jgi:hypothetical protein
MATIEVTSLFNPNPLSNGGTYITGWQDYTNDGGSVTNGLYRLPGQTWISGSGSGSWVRSARSVQTVSGVFTVVLRGPMSMYAYLGLNTEAIVTYPATRYSRAPYAFTTQTVATNGQVSRVFELGVNKGSNKIWASTESANTLAICDTGSAIVYKYSVNNGATWVTHYTSLAAYTPNQAYRVDIGSFFGNQNIMVEVYPSVLV